MGMMSASGSTLMVVGRSTFHQAGVPGSTQGVRGRFEYHWLSTIDSSYRDMASMSADLSFNDAWNS